MFKAISFLLIRFLADDGSSNELKIEEFLNRSPVVVWQFHEWGWDHDNYSSGKQFILATGLRSMFSHPTLFTTAPQLTKQYLKWTAPSAIPAQPRLAHQSGPTSNIVRTHLNNAFMIAAIMNEMADSQQFELQSHARKMTKDD